MSCRTGHEPCYSSLKRIRSFQKLASDTGKRATPDKLDTCGEVLLGVCSTFLVSVAILLVMGAVHCSRRTATWEWGRWPPWGSSSAASDELLESLEAARLLPHVLTFSITLRHLSHTALLEHAAGRHAFEAAVRRSVAAQVPRSFGLAQEQVEVALSEGSAAATVAECTVRPPERVDVRALQLALASAVPRLKAELVKAVKAADELAKVASGDVEVSQVSLIRLRIRPTFDTDADGKVSPSELVNGTTQLKAPPSEKELKQAFKDLDGSRNGFLESSEFAGRLFGSRWTSSTSTSTGTTTTSTSTRSTSAAIRPEASAATSTSAPRSTSSTTSTRLSTTSAPSGEASEMGVVVVRATVQGLHLPALKHRDKAIMAETYRSDLAHGIGLHSADEVMDAAGRPGCASLATPSSSSSGSALLACLRLPPNVALADATAVLTSASETHQLLRELLPELLPDAGSEEDASLNVHVSVSAHRSCPEGAPWPSPPRRRLAGRGDSGGGKGLESFCGPPPEEEADEAGGGAERTTSTPRAPTTQPTAPSHAAGAAAAVVQVLVQGLPASLSLTGAHEAMMASAFRTDLAFAAAVEERSVSDLAGQPSCASVAFAGRALRLLGCLRMPGGAGAEDLQAVLTSDSEIQKMLHDVSASAGDDSINVAVDVKAVESCQGLKDEPGNTWTSHCESDGEASTTTEAQSTTTLTTTTRTEATTTTVPRVKTTSTSALKPEGVMVRMPISAEAWQALGLEHRAAISWVYLKDLAYAMGSLPSDVYSASGRPGCVSAASAGGEPGAALVRLEGCVPLSDGVTADDVAAVFKSASEREKMAKDILAVSSHAVLLDGDAIFSVEALASCTDSERTWSNANAETFCEQASLEGDQHMAEQA